MKLTESMIRDLVTTTLTADEIGDLLTMVGFEIEEITTVDGEKVLDVNIMANRGDGASSIGVAREILAKDPSASPTDLYKKLASGHVRGDESDTAVSQFARVEIETADCTRFTCRVIEGISNGASPAWVQDRLKKIGQRPISLLVDLTNYVMIETGQPLHAYDLDKLTEGRIIVRSAKAGEKLKTLDGTEHELRAGQMMICDAQRPIGVAGVMGGEDTEVSASTTRCLLESAHFDHQSVRKTRKQLGMQTDASYRFERYVDPEGAVRAQNRFVQLLEESINIKLVPGVIDVFPSPPVRTAIPFRTSRCVLLLGMPVTAAEAERYLTSLGCRVESDGDRFTVTPPSWRIDLVREDDLIEEVGRVHGYDKIPEALPIGSTPVGGVHGKEAGADRIREELLRCGIHQTISHSLRDSHPLDAGTERVVVRNPHSPEMALLRNSNLPCLADAAVRNGGRDIHVFETGRVFSKDRESLQLAILSTGRLDAPSWTKDTGTSADFYSLKGTIERLLHVAKSELTVSPSVQPDKRFHPTRQAVVGSAGVFGQIHPEIAEEIGLPAETFLAELDLDSLAEGSGSSATYRPVHRHPAVRRDIAVLVDKELPYSAIEGAISGACGDLLEKQWLFDVYEGQGIEPGKHSLAIAIQLRKAGNFTDEEANQVRDAAVSALESLGAKLRS